MSSGDWQRASSIFQLACDLPPEERTRVIELACGDDARLRSHVESLLAADAADGPSPIDGSLDGLFDADPERGSGSGSSRGPDRTEFHRDAQAAADPPHVADDDAGEKSTVDRLTRLDSASRRDVLATRGERPPVVRVGRYAITDEIGRGGMGIVYRARQARPRRDVALKLLDPDRVGPNGLARFRREAELLGRLQHPGIAQIHEADTGAIEDAAGVVHPEQPFIAMELIEGVPLGHAVEGATRQRRIELLVEVCDAIQYAHQRKIAHLDLKPANILVDGSGRPRVLDFGVAIALDVDLERSLSGEGAAAVAGTLAYMSPEQIRGEADRVDTRADIHALGAIGFELLTGEVPYDVRQARLMDAVQVVLSTAPRSVVSLAPDVDPELAAVIDTAVAADQDQRYESAAALAADLRRWMRSEPVTARAPSVLRSARLFTRRRRSLVVAGGLAVAFLIAGIAAMAAGLVRANRAEADARRQAAVAREAEQLAQEKTEKASAMSDFMRTIIFGLDPELAGRQLTFFDAIDHAADRVHDELAGHPDVEASVRQSLGTVYRRHARYEDAEGHLRQALRLRRARAGDEHPDTAGAMVALANQLFEHAGQDEESLLLLEAAGRIHRQAGLADELVSGWLALDLGLVHMARDEPAAAERAFERCRRILGAHLGADDWNTSRALRGLASSALAFGRADDATQLAREAVAVCEGIPEAAYVGARARLVLCEALIASGRTADARRELEAATVVFNRLVSDRHVRRGELEVVAARLARAEGRSTEAGLHASRALALRESVLRSGHPSILEARLVRTLASLEVDPVRAADELDAVHTAAARRLGPNHQLAVTAIAQRAIALSAAGREAEARSVSAVAAVRAEERRARLASARNTAGDQP